MDWFLQDIFFDHLFPAAMEGIITIAIAAAAMIYRKLTGTKLDADARERLHSALSTGAKALVDGDLTGDALTDAVIRYARASVPAAIERLAPDPGVLRTLAQSKIKELAG